MVKPVVTVRVRDIGLKLVIGLGLVIDVLLGILFKVRVTG